jgi:DNA invertase Pin-like site-specific DNA recombinase
MSECLLTPKPGVEAKEVRYCLYARKSSEDDERQALSIESQIKEMRALAEREGLEIAEIRRESHSAKASGARPEFNRLVSDIRIGVFGGIITWAPDRLSRNAGDLGSLVDLMDQGILHDIRTYGQRFRNSPNEKFLLMILCSQAKLENDNRRLNVKRGQKTKAEMGLRPCMAPLGYLHQKGFGRNNKPIPDPERASIIQKVFEHVAYRGWSGRKVLKWMTEDAGFRTRSGKSATLSILYRMLDNHFYYGYYEYPKDSGVWHKGIHEPLVTKELFEKVRKQLEVAPRAWGEKEFTYNGLLTCGVCGGCVTGEEKTKIRSDGTQKKYLYYRCNSARVGKCKEKYISEEVVTQQILELISKADLSKLPIREKIAEEIRRYKRFAVDVLNQQNVDVKVKELDIRKYAQHLLLSGKVEERREMLEGLKGGVAVKGGRLEIRTTT